MNLVSTNIYTKWFRAKTIVSAPKPVFCYPTFLWGVILF
ncbi:hypothetical protein T190607A01A_40205 [Tenacibaculum sp. 190524A05c]|uniref:Uncharacterized protein n=1 Tax=Tenacibaculum platacis TaxID=3137852 RepID=A0ABM9P469_9FLAO